MRYRAVVFDVGDTLVEYVPDYAGIYGDRLRRMGFSVDRDLEKKVSKAAYAASGEQIRKEQNGAPRMPDEEFARLLDRAALDCVLPPGSDATPFLDRLAEVPLPVQEMVVKEGVFDALERLKGRGYALAIVSNHHARLLDFLQERGLSPYFDPIIISAIVGVEKPNPRIMRLALEGLGLPPQACLYVGDHPLDVLCAKEAGMDVAWICAREDAIPPDIPYEPDYRIASVRDLGRIL